MKKMLEVSSFYKCVPKTTIIWGTIPELWSKWDIIFCDFVPFFAFLPPQRLRKAIFWYNEKSIWRCHHSTPGVSVKSLMVRETNSLVGYYLRAKGYSIQLGVWGVLWAAQQVQDSTLVRVRIFWKKFLNISLKKMFEKLKIGFKLVNWIK